MDKAILRRSERMYGLLLKFYPKSYRQEFGEEMKYVFSESLKDAYREHGEQGIVALWGRTFVDAGKSLFTQHLENKKGGESMKTKRTELIMQNKVFAWIALATGLILSIPLIAMQFSEEWDWKLGDFIVMGALIFGTGFLFVHAARKTPGKYRFFIGIAFLAALILTWVHLAVGIVDSWPFAGA